MQAPRLRSIIIIVVQAPRLPTTYQIAKQQTRKIIRSHSAIANARGFPHQRYQ